MKTNLLLPIVLILSVGLSYSQSVQEQMSQIVEASLKRQSRGSVLSQNLHIYIGHLQREQGQDITSIVSEEEMKFPFDKYNFIINVDDNPLLTLRYSDFSILKPELEEIEFDISAHSPSHLMLEGVIDENKIFLLERLKNKGLEYVDLIYKPMNRVGAVTSQGDSVLGAEKARINSEGINGTGISVGVLSDSYDCLGGAAAGMGSGDLPAVTVLEEGPCSSSDEGRAMIELMYDLAPGATYFFATAFNSPMGFADNIQDLADNGCKIIVDDVGWTNQPYFQDGIIGQKIDDVTNNDGVIYFSAAGNAGTEAYESTNINMVMPPQNVGYLSDYDFDLSGSTDVFNKLTLADDEEIYLELQWDDPFFNAMNIDTDLDLVIYDDPPTTVLSASINVNSTSGKPLEVVSYINTSGSAMDINVLVTLKSGPNPGRIKLMNFFGDFSPEHDTQSPTVYGHPGSEECISVGAVPYWSMTPESFSSHGPRTILFDDTGNPLGSPEVRQAPVISATDGTNNTFFGNDIALDSDTYPNFFGTSAAAPHAAAVAALICDADPTLTKDEVQNLLTYGATDISLPGIDSISGYGLINALSSCVSDTLVLTPAFLNMVNTKNFRTTSYIKASGPLPANDHYMFTAKNNVKLDNTFEANTPTQLTAQTKGCDN